MVRITVPALFMVPTTTSSPTSALSSVIVPSIGERMTVFAVSSSTCPMSAAAAATLLSMTEMLRTPASTWASSSSTRLVASSSACRLTSPVAKSACCRSSVVRAFASECCGPARRACSACRRNCSPSRRALAASRRARRSESSRRTIRSPRLTSAPSRKGSSRIRAETSAEMSTLVLGSISPGAETVSTSVPVRTRSVRTSVPDSFAEKEIPRSPMPLPGSMSRAAAASDTSSSTITTMKILTKASAATARAANSPQNPRARLLGRDSGRLQRVEDTPEAPDHRRSGCARPASWRPATTSRANSARRKPPGSARETGGREAASIQAARGGFGSAISWSSFRGGSPGRHH